MWVLILRAGRSRSRFALWLLCLASLLAAGRANAYTISGTVRYWDSRDQRSDNAGSRLTQSSKGTNRVIGNVLIALYDKDGDCVDFAPGCGESNDDFLAAQHATSSGTYSLTVTGTQDIYVLGEYVIEPSFNLVLQQDGTSFYALSNPVTLSSTTTIDFNLSCPDNTVNSVPGRCDNQAEVTDSFPQNEAMANILASMRDGSIYIQEGTGGIQMYFPGGPNNQCAASAGQCFANSGNLSCCVASGFNNHVVVHEMGHLMHARKMNIDVGQLEAGGVCTSSEVWTGEDPAEKCVTAEGFAHFVSAATWWGQNSTTPLYRGNVLEGGSCVSSGSNPHRRKGNAARYFFDLYDSTTAGEAGQDDETRSYSTIINVWSSFPPGTANRQNRESGANGRNIEDYVATAPFSTEVERDNNCLGAQAN